MSRVVRKNTVKCEFNKQTRHIRPLALEIHKWINTVLHVEPDQLEGLQLDNEAYCVYLKFVSVGSYDKFLRSTPSTLPYTHDDGTISQVLVSPADDGTTSVRILNLPLELDNSAIQNVLSQYGSVKKIVNEQWGQRFCFPVFNGTRVASVQIVRPIPSRIMVNSFRGHVYYDGQIPTCFFARIQLTP